jgi:hypothetical protein
MTKKSNNPDNTVILHWDECRTSWAELSWHDWVRFRGFGAGRQTLLAGAVAGEHYFLSAFSAATASAMPSTFYVLSTDARLVARFRRT